MKRIDSTGLQYAFRLALLVFAYAVTASVILGYFAANSTTSALISIIWPPSGIALAALLMGGKKYWPGVFVGSLLVATLSGTNNPLWVSGGIAVGCTLEALASWWLLT